MAGSKGSAGSLAAMDGNRDVTMAPYRVRACPQGEAQSGLKPLIFRESRQSLPRAGHMAYFTLENGQSDDVHSQVAGGRGWY